MLILVYYTILLCNLQYLTSTLHTILLYNSEHAQYEEESETAAYFNTPALRPLSPPNPYTTTNTSNSTTAQQNQQQIQDDEEEYNSDDDQIIEKKTYTTTSNNNNNTGGGKKPKKTNKKTVDNGKNYNGLEEALQLPKISSLSSTTNNSARRK